MLLQSKGVAFIFIPIQIKEGDIQKCISPHMYLFKYITNRIYPHYTLGIFLLPHAAYPFD